MQQNIRVVIVIVAKELVVFGFLFEKVHSHSIRVYGCDEIMRYEEEYFTFFSEHCLFTFYISFFHVLIFITNSSSHFIFCTFYMRPLSFFFLPNLLPVFLL